MLAEPTCHFRHWFLSSVWNLPVFGPYVFHQGLFPSQARDKGSEMGTEFLAREIFEEGLQNEIKLVQATPKKKQALQHAQIESQHH